MRTGRIAAGLAATAVAGALALVGLAPAQAAAEAAPTTEAAAEAPAQLPVLPENAPVTTTANGTRTLVVDPNAGLAATGAKISVQGKGFDTDHGLYVAVCADGSGAPADLSECVGGAIPDGNTTQAWAHITTDGQGSGGVKAKWGDAGSFSVTLTLPSVTEGNPNCVTGECALYTASDDDSVRSEDNTVLLTFTQPTSPSSTPPTEPTEPTAPTTATPEVIGSPTVVAGQNQIVAFSGFKPGEQVNLTLFSRETALPPVTASPAGVAQTEFTVPADTVAGTHRLEAIGQTSGTVGVASFQVTAPPPVTSASPTPSPSPSPTSSSESSSAPASSSVPASPTVVTSSAVTPSDSSDAGSVWWLWLLIAIVVIAGIVTGVIVWRRKQQEQREKDEADLAAAAAQEQTAGYPGRPGADAQTVLLPPVGPPPGGPPPGQDPYGLLSGRDHPDNPQLYSGQDAGPTEVLGPPGGGPYQGGPGGYPQGPGWGPPSGGAPTQAIGDQDRPTGPLPPVPPAGGPGGTGSPDSTGTSAWTPDFDDTDTGDDDDPSGADGRPPRR